MKLVYLRNSYMKLKLIPVIFLYASSIWAMGESGERCVSKQDTFYLDPVNAPENGSGRTPDDPAIKLPSEVYGKPGTVILYKRGIVVKGDFEVFSGKPGAPVTVGSYGEGEKPVFMGSFSIDSAMNWVQEEDNIWRYTKSLKSTPCANIIYNDTEYCGALRWRREDLKKQGDWFMVDTLSGKFKWQEYLYLYSEQNPADHYQSIEYVPEGKYRKFEGQDSFIIVQDLHIRNVGTHAIWFCGSHHITIRDCDISYVGGAVFSPRIGINGLWVRFGNAVEIWEKGSFITVEGNRIYEAYDAGFVAQGSCGLNCIDSVVVRNNIFWNNGFDNFDNSWGKGISRVYFENNTCVNVGDGWAYETEGRPRLSEFLPDTIGWHVFLDSYDNSTIWIRNNIFYNAEDNKLIKVNKLPKSGWENIILDYNCYYQNNPNDAFLQISDKNYWSKDFFKYQQETGNDKHSFIADPLFVDFEKKDFRLKENSPCKNTAAPNSKTRFIGACEPIK